MKNKTLLTIATAMLALAVLARTGMSAQDKYNLKVPGGLAFSEFRGYEDWAVVAVHHTEDLVKVVVGNPVTMDAFRAGIPGNGKPFPDGSKMAKVEWRPKKSPDAPYDVTVPGTVYDLDFMVKGRHKVHGQRRMGICRLQARRRVGHVYARHANSQAAAGERRQVWLRVPHDSEGKRLRLHGVRETLIALVPRRRSPSALRNICAASLLRRSARASAS